MDIIDRILESTFRHKLVLASAGSGKTYECLTNQGTVPTRLQWYDSSAVLQ